jgi:argininosuccinate lyase
MVIEQRLIEKIGPTGGKLHTARSRNDQIALDERLYLRRTTNTILNLIRRLQKTFVSKASQYETVLMPGYTHLQRAQPILLAHHLLAYVSMLDRDHERFNDLLKRINRSPLGAGALAGTPHPIDRNAVARSLGFDGLVENSIDAVSDRDVLIEFIAHCSITMMHLSRFAEELVLWSSQEWRFVEIGDAFTTGSSIMPQKKNPDMAELVRGKTGRVYGDLMALLTVMKGLPLAYNRDMQEDKEPLFDAADTVVDSITICSSMLKTVKFDAKRFDKELASDFLLATELADYLARKGVPFRKAHSIVGELVRLCIERNIFLSDLPLTEYRKRSRLFEKDIYAMLDPRDSLNRKRSSGSTSQKEVHKAIRRWSAALNRRW